MRLFGRAHRLDQPKIGHFRDTLCGHQDIGWLNVPVDQIPLVRPGQPPTDLDPKIKAGFDLTDPVLFEPTGQATAVDIFDEDAGQAILQGVDIET